MFTGIVREVGRVLEAGVRIRIESSLTAGEGDSVSVNGCCLTAVACDDGALAFDVVPETLRRTTLGRLAPGSRVNLESALRAGDPLGGHYVQGHVDAVGRVRSVEPEGEGRRMWVEAPAEVLRYCAEKGSVAVDGVSLTIAGLDEGALAVALIPYTLAETTLGAVAPGDEVNLEADVLAKYVERLLGAGSG